MTGTALTPVERELLEDCEDDRWGLWEAAWSEPDIPVQQRATVVTSLVGRGLLTVLRITDWPEAQGAPSLPRDEALAIVSAIESYVAPAEGGNEPFYVLAITAHGEAALRADHR